MAEQHMRGPLAAPLDRLLAIYVCIMRAEGKAPHHTAAGSGLMPTSHNQESHLTIEEGQGGSAAGALGRGKHGKIPPVRKAKTVIGSGSANTAVDFVGDNSDGQVQGQVLMQLASLVRSGLIGRSGDDPLDAGAKYRCRMDTDLVQEVSHLSHLPAENLR